MKRAVITTECVTKAHSLGEKQLSVPYSAIVTPAAWDTASACGMAIVRDNAPERCARPCRVPDAPKQSAPRQGAPEQDAAGQGPTAQKPSSPATPSVPSQRTEAALFREIKRRVTEQLPAGYQSGPMLDKLIRKSLEACLARHTTEVNTAPVKKNDVQQGKREASGQAPVPAASAGAKAGWRQTAGTALRVDSRALPWKASSLGKGVNIIDVVGGDAPFRAGYMEWEAASFSWTPEQAELFTIIEGELRVAVNGEKLSAGPGDFVCLAKGRQVEMSSPGYVKFAYAACAATDSKAGA